jgi:phage-related protein
MNINGHELREYHARLQNDLIITTPEVTQYYDWLRRSTVPQFYGSSTTFKQLSFTVSVIDRTDNAAAVDISKLTEQLMRCTIKFDLYNRFYKCILTGKGEPSRIAKGFYDIEYQLKGYCCGLTEAYQSTGSLSFYNHGNLKSPATISITPKKALNQLLVSGLTDKVIQISNLLKGTKVVIDGGSCTVTQNGQNKFKDCELWSFPTVKPGENFVSLSDQDCTLAVTFLPFYM